MLRDYRDWLVSELKLLGNASHHAYSFGQANMAQRAIEALDAELARTLYVAIDKAAARRALTEIEMIGQRDTAVTPGLSELRAALQRAVEEAKPPADEGVDSGLV